MANNYPRYILLTGLNYELDVSRGSTIVKLRDRILNNENQPSEQDHQMHLDSSNVIVEEVDIVT